MRGGDDAFKIAGGFIEHEDRMTAGADAMYMRSLTDAWHFGGLPIASGPLDIARGDMLTSSDIGQPDR